MIIGTPKEIKPQEHRAGLLPSSVRELVSHKHRVIVEKDTGKGMGLTDEDYIKAGAEICDTPDEVFEQADMIIKVKEPQPSEYKMLREGQIIFTYLHLAADMEQTKALMESGCVAIAYETVTGGDSTGNNSISSHRLPLLASMSEIAGRLSIQVGNLYLLKHMGGKGRLIGGSPGVEPARVTIIGGGVSGFNAARMAVGLGADVTILENSHDQIRLLDNHFSGRARVIYSDKSSIEKYVTDSDLVVGSVLIPGASAPKLVSREAIAKMQKGSVMVDIAIDQGGCFETSRPTTHNNPVYDIDGIIHYCVTNMPGSVPVTSSQALNNAVLPYALQLADKGWQKALSDNEGLKNGLNVCNGKITHPKVAASLGLDYIPAEQQLN